MSSLAPSENSAFKPYRSDRSPCSNASGSSTAPSPRPPREPQQNHRIVRPQPRLAVPATSIDCAGLPQEDHSDSVIYRKIQGKQKERPASVGELQAPDSGEDDVSKSSQRSSPVPLQRSNDFKKILQRFQVADRQSTTYHHRSPVERPSTPEKMSPAHAANDEWIPVRSNSREAAWPPPARDWSPAQRSSLNSNNRNSPTSRNTSARSRLSVSSMQSPLSFLPTRDCSPRSVPSPSLIPSRANTDSLSDVNNSSDGQSPLSHTGSTPEPAAAPLTIRVGAPKRRSLPGRWVKETDIDDPVSLPMSPISSPMRCFVAENLDQPTHSAPLSKVPSSDRLPPVPLKQRPSSGRFGGSCRRVLSGFEQNGGSGSPSPAGVYVRRSRSKDDRANVAMRSMPNNSANGSRSTLHSIPIFMSSESVRSSGIRSPSPLRTQQMSQQVNEYPTSDGYRQYQQISLSHMQTLSIVADRLSEELRRGDEPVSRNRLSQLEFAHFHMCANHPVLTKGKSLFYNAILPRPGQPDFPVTLMIAPYSQYAPLMRRAESHLFAAPAFLELEDHDGAIKRFLEQTGTPNLDGRNVKMIAFPRLNLCSFHSLAAHHLTERSEQGHHEEMVAFILLQLLVALKMLQSDGVESLSTNFKEFLLAYRFPPSAESAKSSEFPRLIFLTETLGAEIESGADELVGLCRYALRALCTLLHYRMDGRAPCIKLQSRFSRSLRACANILEEDKSSSLTKAKNVLELALWGPSEPVRSENEARTWIDLARAECVDSLLRQMVLEPGCPLGAKERFRVEFLLSASPRSVIDSHKATLAAKMNVN